MQRRTLLALLGSSAIAGGAWYATRGAEAPLPLAAEAQTSGDAPEVQELVLGDAAAPVTMIEYASFTCPHCATFHNEVFPRLKQNYIDTGKVRFVYREVFFDRFGLWAAMVARCGGEQRYFPIAGLIYEKQREWAAGNDPAAIADRLRTLGKTAGLSQEQLDACLSDGAYAQALVANYENNAKADDITATPSFVIDGQKYSNMPYDELARILDEKLAG